MKEAFSYQEFDDFILGFLEFYEKKFTDFYTCYLLHQDQLKDFFSKSGYINRPPRSRLIARNLEATSLLVSNMDLLNNDCWDPYKRTLNRPKFSETVTVSALAGQPLNERSFGRKNLYKK
ncbi:hypothetical protein BpHYR1_030727 [Brachionus plicatilis]|uniref:Uncharacterized protein n=1 Tax=Brachionus plicatilis TaxID=10195 RepID=A0A3M7RHM3_BRAPC|nr:hypothetical protein BpHYR1_030727 [Brachionus plicatilis]